MAAPLRRQHDEQRHRERLRRDDKSAEEMGVESERHRDRECDPPPARVTSGRERGEERVPAEAHEQDLEAVRTGLAGRDELQLIQHQEPRRDDPHRAPAPAPAERVDRHHRRRSKHDRRDADDELVGRNTKQRDETEPPAQQQVVEDHVGLMRRNELPEDRPRRGGEIDREHLVAPEACPGKLERSEREGGSREAEHHRPVYRRGRQTIEAGGAIPPSGRGGPHAHARWAHIV